ncbi:endopeptidase La [candidate division WWE3 bacterium]|nr:endopeptidase La [candidate division WWE3 bacterium]
MGLFDRKNKPESADEPINSPKENKDHQIPKELPVIALKNTVIYPHTVVPVFFEDAASLSALEAAQKQGGMIGSFALKDDARKRIETEDNDTEVEDDDTPVTEGDKTESSRVKPADLYRIGTACLIHRVMPISGRQGAMVVLQGLSKVNALQMWREQPYITAMVEVIEEESSESKEIRALMKNALSTAQRIIQNTPYLPQELQIALEDLSDPLKFVYLLATLVRFDASEKQMILEEVLVEDKLKKTAAILSRELEQIELGGKIVSNVKKEFNRMSREAFLRQQLKEIQRELGEENESAQEAGEYRQKLEKGKFPKEFVKEISREIDRLETMHPQSSEYQVIRTYLDWVFDIPWTLQSRKKPGLATVEKVLNADHYGLKETKERILEYLAVRQLNKNHHGPILCLVGPPGVGKTSLGKSIAKALGKSFIRMSLGGVHDEAEIRGHRRTYVGAMPGKVIQGMRRAESIDPVFMLDEIDKVGNDYRGDPSSALLEVLDPEQNNTFRDHYLDLDYDLSNVFFIATANVLETIQPALRDRMEIIQLSGYVDGEKIEIAKRHIWPKVLERHGIEPKQVKITDDIFPTIINQYTQEAGVRGLEKQLSRLARKIAFHIVKTKERRITIDEAKLREFLGPQRVFPEVAARTANPGVATGLAWTAAGGEILFIEANKMPGGKKFELTGQLGAVMKESAKIAYSLVRARSEQLGIASDFFTKHDIHLHVPAGAVPKDGPSAGITMTTAIASLALGRPVRNDFAMTGEITLSGLVLPIGGVKEKVIAARRAGIKTVLLPEKNRADIKEVDPSLIEGLSFEFAETIDQVLDIALLNN